MNVALSAVLLCLLAGRSTNFLAAPVATQARTSRVLSQPMPMRMARVSPAPTFRSAVAQAYCEEVVNPESNKKFETMSFMPDFEPSDMKKQG